MSQSLDGIEPGSFLRGEEAENDADQGRKDECNNCDHQVGQKSEFHQETANKRCCKTEANSNDTAQRSKYDRLDEKLNHDVVVKRADSEPNTDLPRSFGDRYEHDVHDTDAAYEQADGGNRAEQCRQNLHRRSQGGEELL